MKYATDRKRAVGLGSGRDGTHHHWQMMMSSMALVVVAPVFVIAFGVIYGSTYAEVVAYLERPLVAITLGVSLVVLVLHVMNEALEAAEDYIHGMAGKLTLVGVRALSYLIIAVGLFALARLAL